jgi:hypothetical protein
MSRVFELRKYELFPGTLERMRERFKHINLPLFERHGIHLEHAWEELDTTEHFFFMASFPSVEARTGAWATYHEDPVFLAARADQATIIKSIELHVLTESPATEFVGVAP